MRVSNKAARVILYFVATATVIGAYASYRENQERVKMFMEEYRVQQQIEEKTNKSEIAEEILPSNEKESF